MTNDIIMGKVCGKLVSKVLTDEQKINLEFGNDGKWTFGTCDFQLQLLLGTKYGFLRMAHRSILQTKEVENEQVVKKMILMSTLKGVLQRKCEPSEHTVNAWYVEVLDKLGKNIISVRNELSESFKKTMLSATPPCTSVRSWQSNPSPPHSRPSSDRLRLVFEDKDRPQKSLF